ncbi:MAG: serine/threonine protein kinase [Labilithrix sp.]|nr:serine/threonine protein kinase [Labilithrix sp.]
MTVTEGTTKDTVVELAVKVKRCRECSARFGLDAAFCPFDGVALVADTWEPARDPLANAVVDMRYEVVSPLGEGGMGTVYKVRHMSLDRFFAMKVLRADLAADADLAERFTQEARATAAIKHPSVVAITDFGTLDSGIPYFVMELLVGETLATRIRARGPLPPREAMDVGRKLAEALSASHAAGVVHRDLKPENVFLVGKASGKTSATDELRIVDFGAAKIVGASKLTRPGVVFGTPYYMSPEQASGQPVDARADVYSLGVLLYEMLTGSVPFEADTYMGVLTKHMFASPARPSEQITSAVPLGKLEDVVMKALEKEPGARYQSMAELAAAIAHAENDRVSEAPPGAASEAKALSLSREMSTADRIQRSVRRRVEEDAARRRRIVVVAVVAAAATIAVGGGLVALLEDKHSPPVTSAIGSVSAPPSSAPPSSAPPSSAPPPEPATSAAPEPSSTAEPAASSTAVPPPKTPAAPAVRPRPSAEPKPPPPPPPPAPRAPPKNPEDFADPWKRKE